MKALWQKITDLKLKTKLIWIISLIYGSFHLYRAIFGSLEALYQRSIHLMFAGVLVFLVTPASFKKRKIIGNIIDILLILCASIPVLYLIVNRPNLIYRFYYFQELTWYEYLFCAMLLIAVLEGTRRKLGAILPIISCVFIAYMLFGQHLPGNLGHSGFTTVQFVDTIYTTTEGIFGIALGASATFVVLFIIFGAFLEGSGVGDYFINVATTLTRKSIGGPAKAAVVSSCLFGSISGSTVANVVTTGQVTIPLMKKTGYSSDFSGAVEAVASTGGQIMPPVMGSAVFIMSEITGIPYIKIIASAALPALLYYYAVYVMVHFEAVKLGIVNLKDTGGTTIKTILKKSYLFLPLVILVIVLIMGFSPTRSVLVAMVALILISFVDFKKRLKIKDILNCIVAGAKGTLSVAMACACSGIIVGIVNYTGIGMRLSAALLYLSQDQLFLALLITAATAIILGMGLPTTPAYIVVATLLVPTIVKMNVPILAAHLFAFYFANVSAITPPVALAAYTAAGLSGGSAFRTGFIAFRLGIASYIVPFMFVNNTSLLFMGDSIFNLVFVAIFAILGVFYLAVAAEGHVIRPIAIWKRIILFAAALLLIYPGFVTSLIGLVVGGIFILPEYLRYRKELVKLAA